MASIGSLVVAYLSARHFMRELFCTAAVIMLKIGIDKAV